MKRRTFLKATAVGSIAPVTACTTLGRRSANRIRPGDKAWPSTDEWRRLNRAVNNNLTKVHSPFKRAMKNPLKRSELFSNISNPYYIGDEPSLTQTLGWIDAWTSEPSIYAVAAANAQQVAAAVDFARRHNLRLVVKGGGHSYHGASNAPDSLLIWTRNMDDILIHDSFVPLGCEREPEPQRAVTLGSGSYWLQAYNAVTTREGAYVQGGGCTTVGVAGLVQSGGFGSFSKYYGTSASSLLEAEVVTADGRIRTANSFRNPDLFWALKGGGGGTFGVVTKVTLRVHELPEFAGGANFVVKATSDCAYRRLTHKFITFYREALFNHHWGEQVAFTGDNKLVVSMVHIGLTGEQAQAAWQPLFEWLAEFSADYTLDSDVVIGSIPARHWWDVEWRAANNQDVFDFDASQEGRVWWKGDAAQVGMVINGLESLWLSESLLQNDMAERLADSIFAASRFNDVAFQFNKGLAGARPEIIAAARDTASNPIVCTSFALAIVASIQEPGYPGIPNHEPAMELGRQGAESVQRAMSELHAVAPDNDAYLAESNYFRAHFAEPYWGANHLRLANIKEEYDPEGLFYVHNGVGSEQWTNNGFTKVR